MALGRLTSLRIIFDTKKTDGLERLLVYLELVLMSVIQGLKWFCVWPSYHKKLLIFHPITECQIVQPACIHAHVDMPCVAMG